MEESISDNEEVNNSENEYLLIDEPSYDISFLSSIEDEGIKNKK